MLERKLKGAKIGCNRESPNLGRLEGKERTDLEGASPMRGAGVARDCISGRVLRLDRIQRVLGT